MFSRQFSKLTSSLKHVRLSTKLKTPFVRKNVYIHKWTRPNIFKVSAIKTFQEPTITKRHFSDQCKNQSNNQVISTSTALNESIEKLEQDMIEHQRQIYHEIRVIYFLLLLLGCIELIKR
jgi:hypothetical protein